MTPRRRQRLIGTRRIAALAGLGLIVLAVLGLLVIDAHIGLTAFFRAYLIACLFWLSLSLGSLAVFMIHQLVGGAWGDFIQGPLKAAIAVLPLPALLFIPLGFAVEALFPWAAPGHTESALLQEKAIYLNVPFFQLRTAVTFVIWIALALAVKPWRVNAAGEYLQGRSALGLIFYALTVTFFAVDWIMSLEPHWYSSAIGFVVAASQLAGALAWATVIAVWRGLHDAVDRYQDLGNLLLAAVMFWIYVAFMQYLIIWSGDLPHEIEWYLHRTRHGWQWIALLLILAHFALPFLLLLSRRIKRASHSLMAVALLVLTARWLDVYWLVAPAFHPGGVQPPWLELITTGAIGSLWLAVFFWLLGRQSPQVTTLKTQWSSS